MKPIAIFISSGILISSLFFTAQANTSSHHQGGHKFSKKAHNQTIINKRVTKKIIKVVTHKLKKAKKVVKRHHVKPVRHYQKAKARVKHYSKKRHMKPVRHSHRHHKAKAPVRHYSKRHHGHRQGRH